MTLIPLQVFLCFSILVEHKSGKHLIIIEQEDGIPSAESIGEETMQSECLAPLFVGTVALCSRCRRFCFVLFCKAYLLLKSMSIGLPNFSCSLELSSHYTRLTHVVSVETRVQISHRPQTVCSNSSSPQDHGASSNLCPTCVSPGVRTFSQLTDLTLLSPSSA